MRQQTKTRMDLMSEGERIVILDHSFPAGVCGKVLKLSSDGTVFVLLDPVRGRQLYPPMWYSVNEIYLEEGL